MSLNSYNKYKNEKFTMLNLSLRLH